MSITVITGVPGSGKTLYAISKLLLPLVGTHVAQTDDRGVTTQHPRTIYTNINGLLIDHELIDGGDNLGLRDWHKWAKPASVICFDEFQRAWPPRPNGSKVPEDIQALDTHRHAGVDFILITQNLLNVDRHILGLCDRHLHVRRMGNLGLAIVYEWDHASKSLLYRNAITKASWRYDKKVFKLYKSAELHTKQSRKIPTLVWFILIGLLCLAFFVPNTYSRLNERTHPKPVSIKPAASPASAVGFPVSASSAAVPAVPAVPSLPALSASAPRFAGCGSFRGVCQCYDTDGQRFDVNPDLCKDKTSPSKTTLTGGLKHLADSRHRPDQGAPDLDLIAWVHRKHVQVSQVNGSAAYIAASSLGD